MPNAAGAIGGARICGCASNPICNGGLGYPPGKFGGGTGPGGYTPCSSGGTPGKYGCG